jgi:hypothetical protein
MTKLPALPKPKKRELELLWLDTRDRLGFAGDHLQWPESKERRHQAARPKYSLAPPPPTSLTDSWSDSSHTYFGPGGEPIPWKEWREQQLAAWKARESDPAVIDTIGIYETVYLAEQRFAQIAEAYLEIWRRGNARYEEFEAWLPEMIERVRREVGRVWAPAATGWNASIKSTCPPIHHRPMLGSIGGVFRS